MVKGCAWVRDYLQNNSNVSKGDKRLCDDVGMGHWAWGMGKIDFDA
jgi:hypothetical protein